MKYITILPEQDTIDRVFKLRRELVSRGWCKKDERNSVLPHVSLSYLKDVNREGINKDLILKLNRVASGMDSISLTSKGTKNWDQKVVLSFDNRPVRGLVSDLDKLLRECELSWNDQYLEELNSKVDNSYDDIVKVMGNHMKLFRSVKNNKLEQVIRVAENFDKEVNFVSLALMSYGCTKEDILWDVRL